MSASLVGSEMCIRDRPKLAREARAEARPGGSRGARYDPQSPQGSNTQQARPHCRSPSMQPST
eukprot:12780125-Alexandrium_andersonii.AAC.1